MRYTIKIQMDNALFYDETGKFKPLTEVSRILSRIRCGDIQGPRLIEGPVWDTNGNTVGSAKITRT